MRLHAVHIGCVICVVKYERVSDGKGSRPKLYRISPEDSDRAEFAARAIAMGAKVRAQKSKASKPGPSKSIAAKGAGAGAGTGVGAGEDDDPQAVCGALKHVRLRASGRAGLRERVTQFTVG